jgi:O-antigen/teichoic acid export membrane protein
LSEVFRAGKAIFFGSLISKGFSVLSTIVLARYLFEEDYGYLVLASIATSFIAQLGNMGFELYYLQFKGESSKRETVFYQVLKLRFIVNIITSLLQFSLGLYYVFFDNKISGFLLILFSFPIFIEGLNAPQELALKDKFQYSTISIGNIYKDSISSLLKILSVVYGAGPLSFGIGPFFGSIAKFLFIFRKNPARFRIVKNDKVFIKQIFNFGLQVYFGSIGMFLVHQIDKIILSIAFPIELIGRYGFSNSNASLPFQYLISPQSNLFLTYISKYSSSNNSLISKLKNIKDFIAVLSFPVYGVLLFHIKPFLSFIFLPKWSDSYTLISLFLFYFLVLSIISPFTPILTGLGKVRMVSFITYIKAFFLISALSVASLFFNCSITLYAFLFISISSFFDVVKVFVGFKFLNFTQNMTLKLFLTEFILVVVLILLGFFNFLLNYSYSLEFSLVFLFAYALLYFLFKFNSTLDLLRFFLKKVTLI